ncbi:MAG: M48 family metallopeptidase [Treponema sp.]|jgi:predicted Zn-dependent protease|nr:M48 family metallopeptidase [Treponema sp.]
MMKKRGNPFLLVLFPFVCFLPACQTVSSVISAGAQVAGSAGIIDQNTANAITQTAEAGARAAEEITPEQEYFIGRAVGAHILTNYKIYTAGPALLAYLNRICNAIVINSPRPEIYNGYHVMILDSTEINAFATSGGHIFITRGLLACAGSEDALAGVIAHEIAHIQLQHSIKAIKTSRITQALLITGASAAGAASGYNVQELTDVFNESVGEIVTTMVNNGYSQNQEFDADATALSLMSAAGYDPNALIEMLKELERNQSGSSGGFGKTHPTPARRIHDAEKLVIKYRTPDTRSFRQVRYKNTK